MPKLPKRISDERTREIILLSLAEFENSFFEIYMLWNQLDNIVDKEIRKYHYLLYDKKYKEIQKKFVKWAKENLTDIKQQNDLFECLIFATENCYSI